MRKEETAPPATVALTLAEVKEYGNINNTTDDARINSLLQPAVNYVERYTGKALIRRTFDIYYNRVELRTKMPLSTLNVSAIDAFKTYDRDATETTLTASTYRLTGNKANYVVFDNGTNFSLTRNTDAAIISVTAGFGLNVANIDPNLRTAMKQMCVHWYRYNGAVADTDFKNIPHETKTLLIPYTDAWNWVN